MHFFNQSKALNQILLECLFNWVNSRTIACHTKCPRSKYPGKNCLADKTTFNDSQELDKVEEKLDYVAEQITFNNSPELNKVEEELDYVAEQITFNDSPELNKVEEEFEYVAEQITFNDSPELNKVEEEFEYVAEEEDQDDGGKYSGHHHLTLLPSYRGAHY